MRFFKPAFEREGKVINFGGERRGQLWLCQWRNDPAHKAFRRRHLTAGDGRLVPGTPPRDRDGRLHLFCACCPAHVIVAQ